MGIQVHTDQSLMRTPLAAFPLSLHPSSLPDEEALAADRGRALVQSGGVSTDEVERRRRLGKESSEQTQKK